MNNQGQPDLRRVRLTGARFEGGRLPVDALTELQQYQDIVRMTAEAEWRRDHPDQSAPDDLRSSVSLTIDRIEDGSADIFLAMEQHAEYVQYQVEAQEMTDSIIVAAYSGDEIPAVPSLNYEEDMELRSAVSSFGKTLEPNQSIEYYPSKSPSTPVIISEETRRKAAGHLLTPEHFLISPGVQIGAGLQKNQDSLVGKITALDTDNFKYRITLKSGQQIDGRYKKNPEILDDLREVVNEAEEGPLTRITGQLQTKDGKLFRFWETTKIEQIQFDDTEWGRRLESFAELRPGWNDGGGQQISSTALDAAHIALRALDVKNIEQPGVFPTVEGGVLLEWGNPKSVVSIELLEDGTYETFSLEFGAGNADHSSGQNISTAVDFIEAVKK